MIKSLPSVSSHNEPEIVVELNLKYPNKIKSVFLIKTNQESFISDIKKSSTPNDWIIARTNKNETYKTIQGSQILLLF